MKTADKKTWLINFDVNKKLNANQYSIVAGVKPQSVRDAMETGLIIADEKGMILPNTIQNLKYLIKHLKKHIRSADARTIDVDLLAKVNFAFINALTPKPKKKYHEFDFKKDVNDGDTVELYLKDANDKFIKMVCFTWVKDEGIDISIFDSNVSVTLINDEIDKVYYSGDWMNCYVVSN